MKLIQFPEPVKMGHLRRRMPAKILMFPPPRMLRITLADIPCDVTTVNGEYMIVTGEYATVNEIVDKVLAKHKWPFVPWTPPNGA